MNRVWCVAGMVTFGKLLSESLGWPLIVESDVGTCDTVLIVGLYDAPAYEYTLKMTARAKRRIIYFCGTDVQMLTAPEALPAEATYLCETDEIARELAAKGIEASVVMFPTKMHPAATEFPAKPAVAFYQGNNPMKYGAHYVQILSEAFGDDIDIYVYGLETFDARGMQDLVDRTSVYLRLTEHDGGCASAREFMEAGRRAVITADLPHASVVSRIQPVRLLKAVREALAEREPDWDAASYYHAMNSRERFLSEFEAVTGVDVDE